MATNVDSSLEGTQDSQSEGSQKSDNQKGSSQAEYVSVTEFNKLQNQIETLRRSLQSDKDKGVKKVSERLDGLEGDIRTVLQSALQKGQNVSDVLSELDLQEERESRQAMLEMTRAFREGRFPQSGSGGTGQTEGVNVDAVLTELELPTDDIRVKAFQAQKFASKEEVYREAAKLVKTLSRQPSDADTATSQEAKQKQFASNQEKLQSEYTEGAKNLRGTALLNFKRDMRKKGWQGS